MMRCRGCKSREAKPNRKTCQVCMNKAAHRKRAWRERRGVKVRECRIDYTPIDEWMANPMNKILRAVRRFDWVDVNDLAFAMSVPTFSVDRRARNALTQGLYRLFLAEKLERRAGYDVFGRQAYEYRVKPGVQTDPPFDAEVYDDGYREAA